MANTKRKSSTNRTTKTSRSRTTSRTKNDRSTRSQQSDKPLNPDLKYEIVVLVFIALSLLFIISVYFNAGGKIGAFVKYALFGTFGITAYLIPIFILVASFLKVFNRGNQRVNNKLSLIFIGFILISAFAHMLYLEKAQLAMEISNRKTFFVATSIYFKVSAVEHVAGGLVGGVVGDVFEIIIGRVGSFIIMSMMALSLIILITEQSLAKIGNGIVYLGKLIGVTILNFLKHSGKNAGEQIKRYNEKVRIEQSEDAQKEQLVVKEEVVDRKKEKRKNIFGKASLPKVESNEDESETNFKANGKSAFDRIEEKEAMEQEMDSLGPIKFSTDTMNFEPIKDEVVKEEPIQASFENDSTSKAEPEAVTEDVSIDAIQTEIKAVEQVDDTLYKLPPIELMKENQISGKQSSSDDVESKAQKLIEVLASFGVGAKMLDVSIGPTVTRYELQPDAGVKVSKIVNLQDDLALGLAASGIRIEAPIPGKAAIGIEVPNQETQAVFLREVIDTPEFRKYPSKLSFSLGKDIGGQVMVADIARMPHLLIAGATGSGKSVCVNTLITSILYKSTPDEVKLLMIDPKVVELSVYNGIPHLLIPVVTEPKKAAGALNWAVQEMADRYKLFAAANVRDLKSYNVAVEENGEGKKLPQIVIIVDELADLMMVAANDVEDAICRLAQMARAAGIHLIIATQRPSVDVITGLIKANIPSRIAFNVSSGTDSRTIIDSYGAEKLLGKGDMLFYPVGFPKPVRIQGAFISDKEVENIVTYLKDQEKAVYNEKIMNQLSKENDISSAKDATSDYDAYFNDALALVVDKQKASASMIQRKFRVGYNRAARIVDQLFEAGFIGDEEGSKPRKVLLKRDEYAAMLDEASGEKKELQETVEKTSEESNEENVAELKQ